MSETQQNPSVYGYCRQCGADIVMRERRLNGDDTCRNGHKSPSRENAQFHPSAVVVEAPQNEHPVIKLMRGMGAAAYLCRHTSSVVRVLPVDDATLVTQSRVLLARVAVGGRCFYLRPETVPSAPKVADYLVAYPDGATVCFAAEDFHARFNTLAYGAVVFINPPPTEPNP